MGRGAPGHTARSARLGRSACVETEIDPQLAAGFDPRPVNAVEAAGIVARRFAGARVVEAELDERDGGPIWEMTFVLGGRVREVDVDAVTGVIRGGELTRRSG